MHWLMLLCVLWIIFMTEFGSLYGQKDVRIVKTFNVGGQLINISRIQPISDDYAQCYVDVVVHNSSSFRFGVPNATVTVLSRSDENGKYIYKGYSEASTNVNGHACVLVYCRDEGLIFVEKNFVRIFALNESMQESKLPPGFFVGLLYSNEFVRFYTYPWGTVLGKTGPVYTSVERQRCLAPSPTKYYFVFSYISIPDRLEATVSPTTHTNLSWPDVWHYGTEWDRRYCFIKVKVKTFSSQIELAASSYREDDYGYLLGIFYSGPQYNLNDADTSERAACIQFRCPVYFFDSTEMNTFLDGKITVPGQPNGCCVSNVRATFLRLSSTKFQGELRVGQNYGPAEGVYIANDLVNARARCFTGHNYLGAEYAMNVNEGFAFEYNCLLNENCQAIIPPVG